MRRCSAGKESSMPPMTVEAQVQGFDLSQSATHTSKTSHLLLSSYPPIHLSSSYPPISSDSLPTSILSLTCHNVPQLVWHQPLCVSQRPSTNTRHSLMAPDIAWGNIQRDRDRRLRNFRRNNKIKREVINGETRRRHVTRMERRLSK